MDREDDDEASSLFAAGIAGGDSRALTYLGLLQENSGNLQAAEEYYLPNIN